MPGSEYYDHTTYPAINATGSSSALRAELDAIEAGFDLLPDLSGNGGKVVVINSGGTAQEAVASLTVAQGGTGRATGTTAYGLIAAGTTAAGAQQTLAAGATTEILVGGGASALPAWTAATGSGAPVRATSPTLVTPDLGTPSALVGTNITGTAAGLTAGTASAVAVGGITGMGTGVGTFLATPSSANLKAALTDETGSGAAVFATSPTLVTPTLGVATATSVNGAVVKMTSGSPGGGADQAMLTIGNASISGGNGSGSIAIGYGAGHADNTSTIAIGANAGSSGSSGANNVFIGGGSGRYATTAHSSVGINGLLATGLTGAGNTAVGRASGQVSTGTNNSYYGYFAGYNGGTSLTGSNTTVIGYNANPSSASVSNEFTLGNSSITTLRCQVTSITSLSDARDKTDVHPLYAGLNVVMQLKPVSFTWAMRDGGKVGIKDSGFIAQDLQEVDDEYLRLVYAENPEKLEASYGRLIPVLVKAIQELKSEFDAYRAAHP